MGSAQKWWMFIGVGMIGSILTGCSPSRQITPSMIHPVKHIVRNGWNVIDDALAKGVEIHNYQIKTDESVITGSLHSDFSVYGSIDKPDIASISVHENNFNIQYYQQGMSAYAFDNGRWSQVAPLANVDLYQSYIHLVHSINQRKFPVYEEAVPQYVVDEYCNVYDVTLPGIDVEKLALWDNGEVFPNMSNVSFTLYIGQKSGQLREVETSSVGAIRTVGPVQVNSDTILFNVNKPGAKVHIPATLVKELENRLN